MYIYVNREWVEKGFFLMKKKIDGLQKKLAEVPQTNNK